MVGRKQSGVTAVMEEGKKKQKNNNGQMGSSTSHLSPLKA